MRRRRACVCHSLAAVLERIVMPFHITVAYDVASSQRSYTHTRAALLCTAILLFSVGTLPAAWAQGSSTASPEQIKALQDKLDLLQNQMSQVQGELRRISGEPAPQQ